jgi:hypothetical protein
MFLLFKPFKNKTLNAAIEVIFCDQVKQPLSSEDSDFELQKKEKRDSPWNIKKSREHDFCKFSGRRQGDLQE